MSKPKAYQVFTKSDSVAIRQPVFEKIDAQVKNGFAFNGNRMNLIRAEVVFSGFVDGQQVEPGDLVLLRGDSGLQPWAKQLFVIDGQEFVLCPEGAVIGYARPVEDEE